MLTGFKFNPHHDDRGRFTFAPDGGSDDPNLLSIADIGKIDLLAERDRGGHTVERHVAKNDNYLLERVRAEQYRIGMFTIGLKRAGSFPSLEAANNLLSSTLAQNDAIVSRVATGSLSGAVIDADFSSPTGREAFKSTDRAQAYMRDTYGVSVVIAHDKNSPRGYTIVTAYPFNRH